MRAKTLVVMVLSWSAMLLCGILLVLTSGCSQVETPAAYEVVGPQGIPGPAGSPGPAGPAGSSCSVHQTDDGAVITCLDGTSTYVSNGTDGQDGAAAQPCTTQAVTGGVVITCPNGSTSTITNGIDGVNGTPGTLITPVQFCPNLGPTAYPSNFPEYGECISGTIYAVYWTGTQAFLAQIPPGQYISTSPQGCTFTVGPNCTITEN